MLHNYYKFFAQSFVIKLSGEKLTTRLRVYTFCGMMKKSISWFDEEENTTGSLTTILSLDAKNVKNVCFLHCNISNDYFKILIITNCREPV